jgi:hypothetical protein
MKKNTSGLREANMTLIVLVGSPRALPLRFSSSQTCIGAFDVDLLVHTLQELKAGRSVEVPLSFSLFESCANCDGRQLVL